MTFNDVRSVLVSKNIQDQVDFLYNYCISKGKDDKLSNLFIQLLIQTNQFESYFNYAIRQSMLEFDVQIIRDKNNNVLLINQSKKHE